ncbi:MAG: hypothetical protein KAT16_00780 [Candidatus Heimdallarchaeota archaeon]|nr:hypothetical protein [Candidatus Heimdallarchaeota archaeon]
MKIDSVLLRQFENEFDSLNPEKGTIPVNILGYGEISLVFELKGSKEPIAYKRLPIFDNKKQVERHIQAYKLYHEILNKLKIIVPPEDTFWVEANDGTVVLYCAQQKINPLSIANRIIHQKISTEEINLLVLLIMRKLSKIWLFNNRSSSLQVGIDGQISNWSVTEYDSTNPKISEEDQLLYLDTSTPMFRVNNLDAMEPILFLKSAPSFLRWALEAAFLDEVVDRYYDFRLVTIDLLANLFKEQRSELIPRLLKQINDFFTDDVSELEVRPITYKEVDTYYNGFLGDRQIWVIFQAVRKMDRYLQTRMRRGTYNFYLPGNIDR